MKEFRFKLDGEVRVIDANHFFHAVQLIFKLCPSLRNKTATEIGLI